ncbi:hypothetical protein ACWA7J_01275 [Leptothrix sp. BB-4]
MTRPHLLLRGLAGAGLIGLTGLSGCIPAPYGTYDRPSYPDPSATLRGALCYGEAGPLSRLNATVAGGLQLSVAADLDAPGLGRGEGLLRLSLTVPDGDGKVNSAPRQLAWADTPITWQDGNRPPQPLAAQVHAHASVPLPADGRIGLAALAPVAAEQVLWPASGPIPTVTLRASHPALAVTPSDRWRLQIPTAGPAGERAPTSAPNSALTSLDLTLASDAGRIVRVPYRTADQQAAIDQRTTACLAQATTPAAQRRCEGIDRYDTRSFVQVRPLGPGELKLTGDAWTESAGRGGIRLELVWEAPVTADWQLTTPQVTWSRPDGSDPRTVPLHVTPLRWHLPVPLSAPLQRRPGATGLGWSLEARLPAPSGSTYRIQLPALDIDGVRHELAPITFDRRRFDGGLMPFNC